MKREAGSLEGTTGFMQRGIAVAMSVMFLAGCATTGSGPGAAAQKQVLKVRWQRLVDANGQTCARCGGTERETEAGVKRLRRCLKPAGVDVALEKTELNAAEFAKDPLRSNQIWIGDKPIEEWLQAKIGKSQCSGACGESECRTLTVDGETYEVIPVELIVRAGLLAGAGLVPHGSALSGTPAGCCPAPTQTN